MFKIFDFGGSFIKIYSSDTEEIERIETPASSIIQLDFLKNIILERIHSNVEYIGISSQMHGIVLYDDFITWKKTSDTDVLSHGTFDTFTELTGLKKRNDLPIQNIHQYIIDNNIHDTTLYCKNITEALLDVSFNKTHDTMACGHGFYDIHDRHYIQTYVDYFKNKYGVNLVFDEVVHTYEVHGYIQNVPVYSGIGDFQASLYGSNISDTTLFINMATGSQIACIHEKTGERPFFNDTFLKCVTHIPSGRFLNIYAHFFKELNIDIWDHFAKLTMTDIEACNLEVTTDIFSAGGIGVSNIQFDNFTFNNLTASIIKHYVQQYIDIVLEKGYVYENILLSGGIAKKIPVIKQIFEGTFKKPITINSIDDDSILGVLKLLNQKVN
jgi:hypothetical protein